MSVNVSGLRRCLLVIVALTCVVVPARADEPMPVNEALGDTGVPLSSPGFFQAQISTYGGTVRSYLLSNPQYDQKEREAAPGNIRPAREKLAAGPMDMVATWDAPFYPYSIAFEDLKGQPPVVTRTLKSDPSHAQRVGDFWALFVQDPVFTVVEASPTKVVMVWPDPAVDTTTLFLERTWTVGGDYRLDGSVRLVNFGAGEVSGRLRLQVVSWEAPGAPKGYCGGSMFSAPVDVREVVCGVGDGVEKAARSAMISEDWAPKKGGKVGFVGVNSRYFLSAALPTGEAVAQCAGFGNAVGTLTAALRWSDPERDVFILRGGADSCLPAWAKATGPLEGRHACAEGERPKGVREFTWSAFIGPKDFDELKSMGANLDDTIDFWILGILAKPMLWLMRLSYSVVPNWALSILFLTLVVKLLTFYWNQKSFVQMRKMASLKPKMDELRNKYKDDKAKLNTATMELYKREKVNPLGGCLPMLLQMPIWIALYRTIYGAVDLFQAPLFLWIDDLSKYDPFFVMPLLLGVVMFFQQKLTPQAGDPAQAKIMLWMMPIMFTAMMLFLPSGLVFYILVNTLTSVGQQWYMNRKHGPAVPAKA